jgi:hypothetical protein
MSLRDKLNIGKKAAPAGQPPEAPTTLEVTGDSALAQSCNHRIKTLDQLLAATKVDLQVWEVERHVINKWEVGAIPRTTRATEKAGWVRPSSAIMVEPLWQVKVWLRRRSPQVLGLRASLIDLLVQLDRKRPPVRPVRFRSRRGGCLAEIDQPDLHLGKLCWAQEAGEDYDSAIAERMFKEGIARHCASAEAYGIVKFLLPIGNDYLNVDNAAGTTTAGTPQSEDGRWQRTYTRGRALLTWAIDYLLEVAPVDVVQVPGNHDFERGFYLADAIACTYRGNRHVRVDNGPQSRKYYVWGNSLLGLTHGDKELTKDLPLTMAVEAAQWWAQSVHREFHCGHIHQKRERVFQPVFEDKGILVRHLSALTASDAWHYGKGYRAQRASSCFIRHPEHGCIAELRFSVPPPVRAAAA